MNKKMEKLVESLKKQRINLETRKLRFELWQDEIGRKDEQGKATIKELQNQMKYWIKQCRLEDRIEQNKIKMYRIGNITFEPQITVARRAINEAI